MANDRLWMLRDNMGALPSGVKEDMSDDEIKKFIISKISGGNAEEINPVPQEKSIEVPGLSFVFDRRPEMDTPEKIVDLGTLGSKHKPGIAPGVPTENSTPEEFAAFWGVSPDWGTNNREDEIREVMLERERQKMEIAALERAAYEASLENEKFLAEDKTAEPSGKPMSKEAYDALKANSRGRIK